MNTPRASSLTLTLLALLGGLGIGIVATSFYLPRFYKAPAFPGAPVVDPRPPVTPVEPISTPVTPTTPETPSPTVLDLKAQLQVTWLTTPQRTTYDQMLKKDSALYVELGYSPYEIVDPSTVPTSDPTPRLAWSDWAPQAPELRGTVKGGTYDGWKVYLVPFSYQGMCMYNCDAAMTAIVAPDKNTTYFLADPNNAFGESEKLYTEFFQYAPFLSGPAFRYTPGIKITSLTTIPSVLTSELNKQLILVSKQSYPSIACNPANCLSGYDRAATTTHYTTKQGIKLFASGYDKSLFAYDEIGRAFKFEEKTLPIIWSTAFKTTEQYAPQRGGCGSQNYQDIVSAQDVGPMSSLVEAGKTSAGEPIYVPKNPATHEEVRKAYDYSYSIGANGDKAAFAEFLKRNPNPLFFTKNAFGEWTRYVMQSIQPQTECGKPVIYLYPEKTTDVSVKLPSFVRVTVSEPTYPSRGWNVVAQPNGQLTMPDGKTYGSLFWEGVGVNFKTPAEGFIVKDGEADAFLTKTLAKYGFNETESREFREFWVPLMTGAPYYRVHFLTDTWTAAAPLSVTPAPDTQIRLFMDWQKIEKPVAITEPTTTTPERKGFTLVEWGGTLVK
ncbi:MAG: hypothetical protein WCV84_05250 [Patescibacteria group bacterium]